MADVCWYHQHNANRTVAATHLVRHLCTECGFCEILAICEQCDQDIRKWLDRHECYNYDCNKCDNPATRDLLGKL